VTPDPRSDRPGDDAPDQDALAVDALPDEVRLHADGDETDLTQTTTGGPEPADENDEAGPRASGGDADR
jgi:hypothetical protein